MQNKYSYKTILIAGIAILALSACQTQGAGDLSSLSEPERNLFEQAAAKRKAGNNAEAIALYTKAAKISSGAVEAHVAIAEILRSENKAAQALPMLQDAIALKPNDPRLYTEKGFSYISQAKYPEAIAAFDKAISLDENQSSAYSGKGVAFDLQSKHDEAQKIYAEATARGLASPSLDNNYALSLVFSGKYDEAIRLLEPHANASTATPTMRQNLALAYGLKGDVGKSMEYGQKDLDPIKARKNLEFYKRYTALKKQEEGMPVSVVKPANPNKAQHAVPVEAVEEGDVGFITETGSKASQVVLKPKVEVEEIDPKEFEKLAK